MQRLLWCMVLLLALSSAQAQTLPAPTVPSTATGTAALPTALTVQRVSCGPRQPADAGEATTPAAIPCGLGRRLHLHFANLAAWMQAAPSHDPSQLRLVINGYELAGLPPTAMVFGTDTLSFDLEHADGSTPEADALRTAWRAILRRHRGRASLPVSIGLKNTPPFFGTTSVPFAFLPPYSTAVFLGLGVLILVLCWLAHSSDILRTPGPDPGAGQRLPYDLGRLQMACWLVVVLSAYLYIWLITGNHDSLTPGALILLGISAATGLSSVLIDASKQPSGAPPAAPAATAIVPSPPARPSHGFLLDILSDASGVSVYRLQMAAWTTVLGVVFLLEVVNDLAMPDFSPTLLGLMGISAGTYVGFKIPESPTA